MKKIISSIFSAFLLISLLLAPISSCSKKDEKNNAEIAYSKAMKLLNKRSFVEAAEAFIKIDEEYPFSRWALKSQTMAVYAYYKEENYVKLLQVVDDFLRLNPASEYVPYMMYMKGLSYYKQIPEIDRAQDNTQQASFAFRELVARFPSSEHAADAKEKLTFIDEHLAGAKMSIGRYDIQNQNYIGAISNFKQVIQRYRYTHQVHEAYFRLVEIYYKIGLKAEALQAYKELKVLENEGQESIWLISAIKINPDLFK